MADNVTITSGANSTPPAGTVVATDDVGGVQYQRIKLDVGGDGASTPVTSTGLPINDAGGSLTVDGTVAISNQVDIGSLALESTQSAGNTLIGAVNETAPASDTASSGLNGRLQRIAQRLTSLIALFPTSLGQKNMAGSLAVTVASDQSAVPASQSGTWTVQPGNTANTTAWKVDASSVAVPVTDNSGSLTVDAPVSTPVFVRLSDGSAAISTLPVTQFDADLGLNVGMDALRDMLVAQRYTVLADSVADGFASFWTQQVANGGSISVATGEGLLQTSTSATGSAQMYSTTVIYYPGQVSWLNSAIRVGDTGSAGNTRRWGAFTIINGAPWDGFYYELSGTTLNAVSCKAGTATAVASGSWTKASTNPFTLDTNYHQFEIRYTANTVHFLVDNLLRHVATGGSTSITQTLDFPISLQTINTSGSTERTLAVRNIGVGRFGQPELIKSTSAVAEGATALPPTGDLSMGWDGMNARALWVQNLEGHNTLLTHDIPSRRLLEEMLLEQRMTNSLLAQLVGPDQTIEDLRLVS